MADAPAIHVVCFGDGAPPAAQLAEQACALAVEALRAAGRGDVTAVRVGDERTGQPGRLIVGLRLSVQPASPALPPLMVISGQTLRPDMAGGRVVPVAGRAMALPRTGEDGDLRQAVGALLRELGLI